MGLRIWSTRQLSAVSSSRLPSSPTYTVVSVTTSSRMASMGGIGHLGKELLEVVEQGLVLVVQHRQRDVDAHGGGGLRPGAGHGQDGGRHILIGVAEGLL